VEVHELLVCLLFYHLDCLSINHRRCEWVAEHVLEEHFKQTLRAYWRKMDPNVPPEVDDGSHEDMKTGKIDDKDKVSL
jgi:hypothetical protein